MQIYTTTVIERTLAVTASPMPPHGRSKTIAVHTLHTINNRQFDGQATPINGRAASAHNKKAQTTHFQRILAPPNEPQGQWNWAQPAMNLKALQEPEPMRLAAFPPSTKGFARDACCRKRHEHMQLLFKHLYRNTVANRYSRGRN